MKKTFIITSIALAFALVGCDEKPYIDAPGDNAHNIDTMPTVADPDPTPDPEGIAIPQGAINVNEAVNIGKKLQLSPDNDHKYPTDKAYFIKGWVVSFEESKRDEASFQQYGNDYVYLSARQDGMGQKQFYCYRILGRGGAKLPSHDVLQIGDFVVIKSKIINYGGIIENDGTCSIEVSSNAAYNEAFPPVDTIYATCAEAKAAALALASGGTSKELYIVEGYVQSAGYDATVSSGQQKYFWIDDSKDGAKTFEAYWCNVPDGKTAIPVGAKVRLTGYIMNYGGTTPEMKNGDIEILEVPEQQQE